MPKQSPFWMVSPKSFIGLIGAEYELMNQSGESVLKKFYISAVLIFVIMITSFLSIFYAVELLTHIQSVEIILSTFLSILFVFIYIFLINTFSKEKNAPPTKSLFVFSNIARISFIIFIAFLIAKPIEIFFFQKPLNKDVDQYKAFLFNEHTTKINETFSKDLSSFQQKLKLLKAQTQYDTTIFETEIAELIKKVDSIENKKKQMIQFTQAKIETSGFFIYRIKQLYKKRPIAGLISFLVMVLFGFPVFLIYSISADAKYYELKKKYERDMIEQEYRAFMEKYTELFKSNFGLSLQFYSKYKDPPFNTVPKEDHKYKPSKDFLDKYCPD